MAFSFIIVVMVEVVIYFAIDSRDVVGFVLVTIGVFSVVKMINFIY
jgi:hypothetical protein